MLLTSRLSGRRLTAIEFEVSFDPPEVIQSFLELESVEKES